MSRARHKPIPIEALERTAAMLRVLAHPQRLRIVELLSEKRLTVGELAAAIGIPPNACSQHLNLMKARGLLASVRDGKSIFYTVDSPNALTVIDCVRKHGM
ncbi:MAG TPA: metalloregulator ArsR/SmtB family transcription factor [Phycisphaerae bacterium]|nr:metalloregulator ArsR/SmtB family transcription factor [Phycisphaerae bacterium]